MKYLTEHEELILSEISRTGRANRTAEEEYGLRRLEKKAKERWGGDSETKDAFLPSWPSSRWYRPAPLRYIRMDILTEGLAPQQD